MSGIAVTTLLNDGLVHPAGAHALPVLGAALISSGVIAVLNYLMIDLLIFRRKRNTAPASHRAGIAPHILFTTTNLA